MAIPTPITFEDDNKKEPEKSYDFSHGKVVDLTPEAIAYIKDFTSQNGDKTAGKRFQAKVVLTIDELDLEHTVTGTIEGQG